MESYAFLWPACRPCATNDWISAGLRLLAPGRLKLKNGPEAMSRYSCARFVQRALADAVEHFERQAARVVGRLQHQRRHGADQHGLPHPAGAVATDVAGHFAAAGGEADQGDVLQVQRFDHCRQVVGVVVHVVAVPRLARAAMAAAVVGDHAIALGGQEQHLRFPAVRAQRPAMAEGDDRTVLRAPVLVVQLHAVAGGDVAAAHGGALEGGGLARVGRPARRTPAWAVRASSATATERVRAFMAWNPWVESSEERWSAGGPCRLARCTLRAQAIRLVYVVS